MTMMPLGPVNPDLRLGEDFSRSKVIKGRQVPLIWVGNVKSEVFPCCHTFSVEKDTSFAFRNYTETGTI